MERCQAFSSKSNTIQKRNQIGELNPKSLKYTITTHIQHTYIQMPDPLQDLRMYLYLCHIPNTERLMRSYQPITN